MIGGIRMVFCDMVKCDNSKSKGDIHFCNWHRSVWRRYTVRVGLNTLRFLDIGAAEHLKAFKNYGGV